MCCVIVYCINVQCGLFSLAIYSFIHDIHPHITTLHCYTGLDLLDHFNDCITYSSYSIQHHSLSFWIIIHHIHTFVFINYIIDEILYRTSFLFYSEALNGMITVERLKKCHKKVTFSAELWNAFVSHIRYDILLFNYFNFL